MEQLRFLLAGDSSLCVEFGNEISEEINRKIRAFSLLLTEKKFPGITELVPTYRSLLVHYDPELISYETLKDRLDKLSKQLSDAVIPPAELLEIPVLYDGEMGPDLHFVAEHAGISEEEVIRLHSEPEYLIYMLGFTPGFTYLGGLPEKLETPRLSAPRVRIDAGSVGIAGKQTGVYPIASPGGWQLIGRTPVRMYDPDRETPILPRAGQYIKFVPVTEAEYHDIEAQVKEGSYSPKRRLRKEV